MGEGRRMGRVIEVGRKYSYPIYNMGMGMGMNNVPTQRHGFRCDFEIQSGSR